jgi:uncharacterized protein (TIGR02996 family)
VTDYDALLGAIIENPAEDTPRLVFADWLDEHADAFPTPAVARLRAAFIRDDIGMSLRDEYDPLRLRWELIEKPQRERDEWVKSALPALPRGCSFLDPPLFRRGFVWGVACEPDRFLANTEQLLACGPDTLALNGRHSANDPLLRSPHFSRFTGLRLRKTFLWPRSVRALLDAPHPALEDLDAGRDGLRQHVVGELLRAPLFARLKRLDFDGARGVGVAFVDGLPADHDPVRLSDLGLSGTGLSGAHVARLVSAPDLRGLTRLSLARNGLAARGHEALARADLPHLRELDLSETGPGAEGFRALSTAPVLSRLRRLVYRGNHVNSILLAELATCAEASNLRVLDLSSNPIGNDGAAALARSPHLAGLLVLDLSYSQVGDGGIEAILESPLADGLVLLNLTGSPASAEMKEVLKARMGDRVRI